MNYKSILNSVCWMQQMLVTREQLCDLDFIYWLGYVCMFCNNLIFIWFSRLKSNNARMTSCIRIDDKKMNFQLGGLLMMLHVSGKCSKWNFLLGGSTCIVMHMTNFDSLKLFDKFLLDDWLIGGWVEQE